MVSTKFSALVTLFLMSWPCSQSLEGTRRVKSKSEKAASKSVKSEKSVQTKSPKSKSSKSKSSKKSWEYPKVTKSPTLQPKKQTKSPKSPKNENYFDSYDSHKVSKSTKVTPSPSAVATDAIVTANPTVRTTQSPTTSSPIKSPASSPIETIAEDAILSPNIIQCSLIDQQEDGTSQSIETNTVSLDYAIVTSTIDDDSLNESLQTLESELMISLEDMCNSFDRKLFAYMKRSLQVKSFTWGPMNIKESSCGPETCDISISNEVEVITIYEDSQSVICEMISLIENALESILMIDSLGLEDAHLDSSYTCHPRTQDVTPTTAQNEPTSPTTNTNVTGGKDIGLYFVSGVMIAIIALVIMKVVISKKTHHEIEKSEHQVEIGVGEDETLCTDEGSSRLFAKTLTTGSYKFVDDQVDQNDCEENEHEHSSLKDITSEPIVEIEVDTRSFISSISDLMNAF